MSEFILATDGVWHTYEGGLHALRGITVTIRPGEFVAFVGENGSGKSTLIKHLNGLLKPSRGVVHVNGQDTRRTRVSRLARTVGFVFQNPDHQIFCYSVWEETLFGLKQLKIPAYEAEARAARALETVGLYERRDRHPRELSRGQRQRLATASVLALETPVLVLDEPTTGQDFLSRRQIMDLATDLHARGRTILMVTHDMALVAEYVSRVIVMKAGQVLLDAAPKEVFDNPEVLAASGLRVPPAVELANALRTDGWPVSALTPDELCRAILSVLRNSAVGASSADVGQVAATRHAG